MKYFSFLCLYSLVFFIPLGTIYSTNSTQLQSIQKTLTSKKKILTTKKKQASHARRTYGELARQLKYIEISLTQKKGQIQSAEKSQSAIQSNLQKLQYTYQSTQAEFEGKMITLYKYSGMDVMAMLFVDGDFFSSLDIKFVFEGLFKQDIQLFKSIQTQYREIETQKSALDREKRRIKQLTSQIQKKEAELSHKKRAKYKIINSLNHEIKSLERHVSILKRSSNELMKSLSSLKLDKNVYYGTGHMIRPVRKAWISSRYGYRRHPISKRKLKHNGIDLAAPTGYKIKASDSGVVVVAGRKKKYRGYGNVTVIDHGFDQKTKKRLMSVYAHQSRILVKKGSVVQRGDVIGLVGSTGYSTGPHLHFEIRLNGVPVNPSQYVRF